MWATNTNLTPPVESMLLLLSSALGGYRLATAQLAHPPWVLTAQLRPWLKPQHSIDCYCFQSSKQSVVLPVSVHPSPASHLIVHVHTYGVLSLAESDGSRLGMLFCERGKPEVLRCRTVPIRSNEQNYGEYIETPEMFWISAPIAADGCHKFFCWRGRGGGLVVKPDETTWNKFITVILVNISN